MMSDGTRKAIAGTMRGVEYARAGAREAVRRFDAANTAEEVRAVLAWAKARGGWFLTPSEEHRAANEAFMRARGRVCIERREE